MSTETRALSATGLQAPGLAPKVVRERIAVLDIQRGIALLLIFLVNIPDMGNTVYELLADPRLPGWQPADQVCWWFFTLFVSSPSRVPFEFLLGVGAPVLLNRTLKPEGAVEVTGLYFRRNFWLAVFGIFDIFGLLWFLDILLEYSELSQTRSLVYLPDVLQHDFWNGSVQVWRHPRRALPALLRLAGRARLSSRHFYARRPGPGGHSVPGPS